MAGQPASWLLRTLARAAALQLSEFKSQELAMLLWALSRSESLNDACRLFDQARRIRASFIPLYFGALLMECEQRELLEHEIAILKGLEGAVGNHGAEMGLGVATKRFEAMRLASRFKVQVPFKILLTICNSEAAG